MQHRGFFLCRLTRRPQLRPCKCYFHLNPDSRSTMSICCAQTCSPLVGGAWSHSCILRMVEEAVPDVDGPACPSDTLQALSCSSAPGSCGRELRGLPCWGEGRSMCGRGLNGWTWSDNRGPSGLVRETYRKRKKPKERERRKERGFNSISTWHSLYSLLSFNDTWLCLHTC